MACVLRAFISRLGCFEPNKPQIQEGQHQGSDIYSRICLSLLEQ